MTHNKVQFRAMGTDVQIVTDTLSTASINDILRQTEVLIVSLEHKLSRFITGNELHALNASHNHWHSVSAELAEVLHVAESAYMRSRGLFNPFLGNRIVELGYDRSFETLARGQDGELDSYARQHVVTMQHYNPWPHSPLEWSPDSACSVRLIDNVAVDLGGIAKGWIVEKAADFLLEHEVSSFVIDAGGDMVMSGQDGERPWQVEIYNPLSKDSALVLDVVSTCVATSGIYKRNWLKNGLPVHHILNPETGFSAQTDILSCSIFHSRLTEAEWMAKAVLIQGSGEGVRWLEQQNTERGWVIITDSGEVLHGWT